MRDEDIRLFPLTSIGGVLQLYRQHLTGDVEPDLTLLSIVAGFVENSMTSSRNVSVGTESRIVSYASEMFLNLEEPEVADVENLRLDPPVELHIVKALYAKFESAIRGYCDVSLFGGGKFATRGLIKRVSDVIWNTLAKSQYKERAHLQSLYSYLTGGKLDCFGVALATVAGCQVLGYSDVHLALSEDHAWVVFGEDGLETAEVTWHGKGNEDKRGQCVEMEKAKDSWLYVGGKPVLCDRYMEVAALVSSINSAITPSIDCLEVGVLQQELLWLLYDLGHLERYPMALGNLGDLEEVSATPGRPPSQDIYDEAVSIGRKIYLDYHVYPYTYLAGFYFRQNNYKQALEAWASAANIIKRYKYSKDDEEIYKEFMEINNELIPHILKADENLLSDSEVFGSLLHFYDGLCRWEEDSSTPVLHTGWVKPIIKCFSSFEYGVRSRLNIILDTNSGTEGNPLSSTPSTDILRLKKWSFENHLPGQFHLNLSQCVPETFNNNNYNKKSLMYCDKQCDIKLGHYENLYEEKTMYTNNKSTHNCTSYNFETMHVDRLFKFVMETEKDNLDEKDEKSARKQNLLNYLSEMSGEKLFDPDYFLGAKNSLPFIDTNQMKSIDYDSHQTKSLLPEMGLQTAEKKHKRHSTNSKFSVKIYSAKMGALKDLLLSEKLNSSALHLQLTAQSQTEVKKSRPNFEPDFSTRIKRLRRD